ICAVFKNHYESGIPDLYSLHSWITTMCLSPTSLEHMDWVYSFIVFSSLEGHQI
ncbi:unnamed protein product, partial [Brassica rapa subsp. trilocularis]